MKFLFSFLLILFSISTRAADLILPSKDRVIPQELKSLLIKDHNLIQSIYWRECPEVPATLPERDAKDLKALAQKMLNKSRYCEAIQALHELRRQHPLTESYGESWYQLIVVYLLAHDYIGAINEANDYLEFRTGVDSAQATENAKYLVMLAVHLKISRGGVDQDQTWTEYGLGIHTDQHKFNPYFLGLAFESYLKMFPQGTYVSEVQEMRRLARNKYCIHAMNMGKWYRTQGRYYPAILMFKKVLGYGPIVDSFPEAMYETAASMRAFAEALKDENKISDKQLANWIIEEKNRDRLVLSSATLQQAIKIWDQMKNNLKDSPWTAKATALFTQEAK